MTLTPGTRITITDPSHRFHGYSGTVVEPDEFTLPAVKVELPAQRGWIHGHTLYVPQDSVARYTDPARLGCSGSAR